MIQPAAFPAIPQFRILAALLALFVLSACTTSKTLEIETVAPVPTKYAALVVDAKKGEVLYAAKAEELRYPASLTKMMTVYLLLEAVDQGRVTKDSQIPVSANAASKPASKLYLKTGSTISVDAAIRALVVKSANDVATAVAEFLGGTEEQFAEQMTAKARSLGMSRTVFRNASGLPDPQQVTTATDMARLAIALRRKFPHHYGYFAQRTMSHNGREVRGHNKAMDLIPGADGLKTGYTRASGFNLVTSVRRSGRSVIGVVLGEDSARVRDQRMAALIEAYLPKAK